jgi:hypothetical protein
MNVIPESLDSTQVGMEKLQVPAGDKNGAGCVDRCGWCRYRIRPNRLKIATFRPSANGFVISPT